MQWVNGETSHAPTRTLGTWLDRPVNDRDFDVGLHVVFEDRAAHDEYQPSERHEKFIAENKHLWNKVRVFDSDVFSKK